MARNPVRRPPTPAQRAQARSNLTDETIRELMYGAVDIDNERIAAKAELTRAIRKLTAHYKRCEDAGIAKRHVKWYLQQYKRPVEEVFLERQERRRISVATNLPLDPEWDDVLPGAPEPAPDPAEADQQAARLAQCYDAGYEAAQARRGWETCPHAAPTPERDAWMNGWEAFEAQQQAAPVEAPVPHDDLGPVAEDDIPVFQ